MIAMISSIIAMINKILLIISFDCFALAAPFLGSPVFAGVVFRGLVNGMMITIHFAENISVD